MSNCINTFAKVHTPSWCEEDFMNKTIKNIVPCTQLINALTVNKLLEHFMKKNCKRQIKQSLELKK